MTSTFASTINVTNAHMGILDIGKGGVIRCAACPKSVKPRYAFERSMEDVTMKCRTAIRSILTQPAAMALAVPLPA